MCHLKFIRRYGFIKKNNSSLVSSHDSKVGYNNEEANKQILEYK